MKNFSQLALPKSDKDSYFWFNDSPTSPEGRRRVLRVFLHLIFGAEPFLVMKALITGGAGFIGSHLAEALYHQGAEILILDDLSEGSVANLAWHKSKHAPPILHGHAGDEKLLREAISGCDWVFHHAALSSVPKSIADPLASHAINVNATLQLLTAASAAGVKRFFFASSAAVYGDTDAVPKREALALSPMSPYALQKYAAEKYCQLFHQLYGLETVCFRYFNIFGPRQSCNSPYSGVIARFCNAVLRGQAPIIYGDGHQTRDFTYVDNVVAANLLAAEAPAGQVAGKVFNVASGQSISLLELVQELNRLTGQNLVPTFEAPRAGDVRQSAADITAIEQALGFKVKVSWQEGLARTLDYYRELSGQPVAK